MEYKCIPQQHKTQRKTLPQIWYNTPPRLKPKSWELVIQWHGIASFSHMSCLDLYPHRLWKWNYRVIHHIWLSQHPQTCRIYLIQIWCKTTLRLKQKSMETNDTRAWVCKLFIHVFVIFWIKENFGDNIIDPYIIYFFPIIIKIIQMSSYKSDIKLLQYWSQIHEN